MAGDFVDSSAGSKQDTRPGRWPLRVLSGTDVLPPRSEAERTHCMATVITERVHQLRRVRARVPEHRHLSGRRRVGARRRHAPGDLERHLLHRSREVHRVRRLLRPRGVRGRVSGRLLRARSEDSRDRGTADRACPRPASRGDVHAGFPVALPGRRRGQRPPARGHAGLPPTPASAPTRLRAHGGTCAPAAAPAPPRNRQRPRVLPLGGSRKRCRRRGAKAAVTEAASPASWPTTSKMLVERLRERADARPGCSHASSSPLRAPGARCIAPRDEEAPRGLPPPARVFDNAASATASTSCSISSCTRCCSGVVGASSSARKAVQLAPRRASSSTASRSRSIETAWRLRDGLIRRRARPTR